MLHCVTGYLNKCKMKASKTNQSREHRRAKGRNNSLSYPQCSNLLTAALWQGEPVSALCQDPGKIQLQFSFCSISVCGWRSKHQNEPKLVFSFIHQRDKCPKQPYDFMIPLQKHSHHFFFFFFFFANMDSWSSVINLILSRSWQHTQQDMLASRTA